MRNSFKTFSNLLTLLGLPVFSIYPQSGGQIPQPLKPLPYTREELLTPDTRDTYEGDYLTRIAFPLGGIGTGCISFSGSGKLVDWEIFNNPNKGYQPRFSFISVWAKAEGEEPVFKVLEGQLTERLDGPMYLTDNMNYLGNGDGPQQAQGSGLPRMRTCRFIGRFPFARVVLEDSRLPLSATLEAWSPFIPGNNRDSSIPVAIFNVTLHNTTSKPVELTLGMNVQNRAGKINRVIREPGFYALYLQDETRDGNSMFVASPEPVTTWQTNWQDGNMFMSLEHFVRTFAKNGRFDHLGKVIASPEQSEIMTGKAYEGKDGIGDNHGNGLVGSIGVKMSLQPGEQRTVPLILGWYFPIFDTGKSHELGKDITSWKNYYAVQWNSGLDVARYVVESLHRLEADTRLFQETFFSSTLPGVVKEAISTQLSVLRSPTIIRYPDGTLYGWEGCAINERRGYGTCNHVWNYQQVIPYLFPGLQRSILENFYFNGLNETDGAVQFRLPLGPGAKAEDLEPRWTAPDGSKSKYFPAADGQLGMVCQVYRDWQICGDDAWLKKLWPRVKKSLEYAWVDWDQNRDGLLENTHHNTLDLNFTTPDPFCGSIYMAALLAGERIAQYLGDDISARKYREVYQSGKKRTDAELFNGEFYHQMLPAPGDFQLGEGSISEQVHGELYSRMLGLEDVFDSSNIQKALTSLFKYNYRQDMYDFINVYRVFSTGGEGGVLIASWPKGGRPERPLLYADETMTGFEYQVAGNLLYGGYILEGLTVIKSIRDRYDGKKRNPYDEIEWGHHYSRSMANYSSLLALSGFLYSGVENSILLDPQIYADNFKIFYSVEGSWGTVSQKKTTAGLVATVESLKGNLNLKRVILRPDHPVAKAVATLGNRLLETTVQPVGDLVEVTFSKPQSVKSGDRLVVTL